MQLIDMTEDEMTNAEKIAEARRLLCEVADSLDGDKTICQCCGLTKYNNRGAYQLRTQLEAMGQKLLRFEGDSAITDDITTLDPEDGE